ncbi:MAG: extracellular solute-binding protein [Phycisphaerae bacterium]|nr:extracellular solute-binding protein [Phycisphaerae bacterium]
MSRNRGSSKKTCGFVAFVTVAMTLAASGCDRAKIPSVVIYTSVDQQFAQQILTDFEKQTGIHVEAVYDTEAGKTTGFLNRIRREAAKPRCDVWWSSEVFTSIELANAGMLESYDSPATKDIPTEWKDQEHRWTGMAARARVLAFHTERVDAGQVPTTWRALADEQWASRLAIANPQFGTTRGHVAAMFALWGHDDATEFLQRLKDGGVTLSDGNAHGVRMVAGGQVDLCMTDTDDVWSAQARGEPIDLVYPAMTDDGRPLWMPCSIALIKGGPNPDSGRKLVDYLASAAVEEALAKSESRNVPVREALRTKLGIGGPAPVALDYAGITEALPDAMKTARSILLE